MDYKKVMYISKHSKRTFARYTRAFETLPQGRWITRSERSDLFGVGILGAFGVVFLVIALGLALGGIRSAGGLIGAIVIVILLLGLGVYGAMIARGELVSSALFLPRGWSAAAVLPHLENAAARAGLVATVKAMGAASVDLALKPKVLLWFKDPPDWGGGVIELQCLGAGKAAKYRRLKGAIIEELDVKEAEPSADVGRKEAAAPPSSRWLAKALMADPPPAAMAPTACPRCNSTLVWVAKYGRWWCPAEQAYL